MNYCEARNILNRPFSKDTENKTRHLGLQKFQNCSIAICSIAIFTELSK